MIVGESPNIFEPISVLTYKMGRIVETRLQGGSELLAQSLHRAGALKTMVYVWLSKNLKNPFTPAFLPQKVRKHVPS